MSKASALLDAAEPLQIQTDEYSRWRVEHRPDEEKGQCGAVVVDEHGRVLFDTFTRDLGKDKAQRRGRLWYDVAGYADLKRVVLAMRGEK